VWWQARRGSASPCWGWFTSASFPSAGWQDLRTKRNSNGQSLGVVGCFAVWAAIGLVSGPATLFTLAMSIVWAVGVFGAGAIAFAFGIVGGGDVKLLAAASLFAGPVHQLDFLTVTALAGGALGLAVLAGAPIGPAAVGAKAGEGAARARLRAGLPYGPAIAVGGLWVAGTLAVPL
jgi:prepilin peptidase CpaA